MFSNKSCACQIFILQSPKALCLLASKPGQSQDAHEGWIGPWRSNHAAARAAVTSALARESWNHFSWKNPLKSSSPAINPPPTSQFTPPRRDFSGKASCLCPDQGKNPLEVTTEQQERAWSKPGRVQPCSYRSWSFTFPILLLTRHLREVWKRALPSDKAGLTGFMDVRRDRRPSLG